MLLISAVTQCHTGSSSNSVMWNMATHMRCMVAHHLLHGSLKDTKTHTYKHTHTHTHTHTPVVCPSMCSLLTCVEPPACGARAACHCLSSVMDVPFVAHTHTSTHRQWRGSAQPSCPPKDEFLLCLGKRMWSHSLKIQPMSLATHDLIQASPLCRVPLPLFSAYFLLLSLWLPISHLFLSIYIFLLCWWWKPIDNNAWVIYGGHSWLFYGITRFFYLVMF